MDLLFTTVPSRKGFCKFGVRYIPDMKVQINRENRSRPIDTWNRLKPAMYNKSPNLITQSMEFNAYISI